MAGGKDRAILEKLSLALKGSARSQHWSLSLLFHWTKHVTWPNLVLMEMAIYSHHKKSHLDTDLLTCSMKCNIMYHLSWDKVESQSVFLIMKPGPEV